MTIGRPSGNAWIGKPLDLVIPLELDRSESGDSLCLEADVVQGETRLDDKRVTLSLDPGPNPDAPRVRLRTTRAVEEPVVTVRLTAGCVTKSTRQYVLLADLPEAPPVVASPSRLELPPLAAMPDRAGSSVPGQMPASRPTGAGGSAAARASAGAAVDGGQAPAPQPRRRVAAVAPSASGAEVVRKPRPAVPKPVAQAPAATAEPKSRLQVDALAPEPQAQAPRPALAPANAGTPGTVGAAAASAQAAAAPAVPASPQAGAPATASGATPAAPAVDPASASPAAIALAAATEQGRRDAERLKEMEATLAALREQSAQTQRQLLELRGSLGQAEADRYRNPVIYGLLALLALALMALVVLWRQARNARQAVWWGAAAEESAAGPAAAKPTLPRHGELADDDDDEDEAEASTATPADVSGLRSAAQGLRVTALPAGVGASAFQGTPARQVNAEQLFDVQQQSDFFMSLGQHEQAIGVLREHIAARPDTSAMAYLELLSLLKSLGRRTDYAAVAREFGHAFGVSVPDFDQFTGGEQGLEHYPDVLVHIVDKWPSQGTADLIEAFVFRKPDAAEDSFDLPAYQDLLLLYAVARDLSEYTGAWAAPQDVSVTPPLAMPSGHAEHTYQRTAPMPFLPGAGTDNEVATPAAQEEELPQLGLDLSDLDRTAFETLRAPIEPGPAATRPPATPSVDPHVIDFDPFDPETNQGELRPRHLGVKR